MAESSVYRVTEVIGVSSESWEDAARAAVETAGKTVRGLRIAEVIRQDLTIDDGGVVNFRTRLGISFKYGAEEGPRSARAPRATAPRRRRAARPRAANSAIGLRRLPMRSTSAAAGIAVRRTSSCSAASCSMTSWCRRLRPSTIEKKPRTCGALELCASTSRSWANVREDSVAGISGTSSTSAASKTLSDTSEMLGGQSRNT